MDTDKNKTKTIQDCIEIIDLLGNIHEKYTIAKPARFDEQGNSQSLHISFDEEKICSFLKQVVNNGFISKIANSDNQELISKFYKSLQNIYEILQRQVGGISKDSENVLIKMRSSFCSELPADNITKAEIEQNIQKIEKRRIEVEERNRIAEQEESRKQQRNRNIVKVILFLLAGVLYLAWGEKISIAYLIVYFLVFGIRQINKYRKRKTGPDVKEVDIQEVKTRKANSNKQTSKEILLLELDKAEKELHNDSFALIKVHFEKAINKEADKLLNWILDNSSTPLAWIYSKTSNVSGDMVESGKYNIYRNTLNGTGQDLLKLFDDSTDKLCELGEIEKDYAKRQKENIREYIKGIG